jgi:hypothetical protein
MSFSIPATLRTVNTLTTPSVINVELNDVDIDRMMTHVLELGVKQGRRASSRTDPTAYEDYLDKLTRHHSLQGFTGNSGRAILDGWVRASVLQFERGGRQRAYAKMGYVRPLTVAAYRSGLPKLAGRNRKADALAYRAMTTTLTRRGAENARKHLNGLFIETFGRGVELGQFPYSSPEFNGDQDVDIDTLLALRFLEGFEGSNNPKEVDDDFDPPVPAAVEHLGRDLVDFLTLYGPALPVAEAYTHLSALMALRLFQLPLITAHAVRALLDGAEDTPNVKDCELYCDFVHRRGSASDELSRQSVQRDLEVMGTFFGDRLLLRSIGDAAELLPELKPQATDARSRLAAVAALKDDQLVQIALGMKIQEIESQMQDEDGRVYISELRSSGLSKAEQLKALLVEGLRKRGLENQVKWFWSTGGVTKPYGLMAGTLNARSTWRYAPSDECLTTLLAMCFVEADGVRTTGRLPIRSVLARLEDRFGILVDRPPAEFDTADARSGAAENLAAFTRQLQLLGCFEGLSDDFNAQFVTRPREAIR